MNLLKSKSTTVYLPILFGLLLLLPSIAFADGLGLWWILWLFVNNVFGSLAALAGILLDLSISKYIFEFGDLYSTGGWGSAVDTAWLSIRDFFNITFIFGMVYLGFQMILNSDDSQTKKWLISLIMAAVLVNFSLYITKFVIDISNSLASEIISTAFINEDTGEVDVSESFMDSMGLTSLFDQVPDKEVIGESAAGYVFGAMIIFIVMMFVFGAGAILLTIRFVVLLLYMVFSPFMFIGWVFPQLKKYTDQYWSGFLGRAFFAPIYLLLLYVSLSIIQSAFGVAGKDGSGKVLGIITESTGADKAESLTVGNSFPIFMIASIFLIASLVVAQKMGASGGDAVVSAGKKFAGKVRQSAGSMTAGTVAWTGRNTAGRFANDYANSDKGKARAANSLVGKIAFRGAQGVAGSSFDARSVGGVGKSLGVGTGQKGGYTKTAKDEQKKEDQFVKDIKTNVDVSDPEVKAKVAARAQIIEKEKNAEAEKIRYDHVYRDGLLEKRRGELREAGIKEDQIEKEIVLFDESLEIKADELNKEAKKATKFAEAELKFANEISYMNRLSNKKEMLTSTAAKIAAPVGAAVGVGALSALTVGSGGLALPLIAGAAAFIQRGKMANLADNSHRSMINNYGKDGMRGAKKEAEKSKMRTLKDVLEENSDSKEKSNDTKDQPKDE